MDFLESVLGFRSIDRSQLTFEQFATLSRRISPGYASDHVWLANEGIQPGVCEPSWLAPLSHLDGP